jgi:CRISPR-associated protein Cmr4
MFEKAEMLYLYVETPLHAGSGSSVGIVDLPIQRERVTGYPLVQASGIKGKLRAEAYEWPQFVQKRDALIQAELTRLHNDPAWAGKSQDAQQKEESRAKTEARKAAARELGLEIVFGPESDEADEHAGALSPGDARLLLFPVRSLVGVFAWTTSRNVLARLKRDLEAARKPVLWALDTLPDNGNAWTVDNNSIVANGKVVLEEFSFTAEQHDDVKTIAKWLADNAIPETSEYAYFKEKLYHKDANENVTGSLVILPDDAFRDFTEFATEVVARTRIDQSKGTVAEGALWTEEHLPSDTVLYAPLHATRPRKETTLFNDDDGRPSAAKILEFVRQLIPDRIQLGGDETVGRGVVNATMSKSETPTASETNGVGNR